MNLSKLPEIAWVALAIDDRAVLVKRGEVGYYPTDYEFPGKLVDDLNARLGVSKEQAMAMEVGSLFGFHVPGADPDYWNGKIE